MLFDLDQLINRQNKINPTQQRFLRVVCCLLSAVCVVRVDFCEKMSNFDIIIVGAGMSGIGLACHIKKNFPDKTFVLLESRSSHGGTWDTFSYPGIRSDSTMFAFSYTFFPWLSTTVIAAGKTILGYLNQTLDQFSIRSDIQVNQSVLAANWSSQQKNWSLQVKNNVTNNISTYKSQYVFLCTGYFDHKEGYTPDFPGRDRFKGQIIHPQHWPESLDYTNKRVVVIGSGATAITLIPSMTDKANHVVMLQRSPSYIASIPATSSVAESLLRIFPKSTAFFITRWANILYELLMYQIMVAFPKYGKDLIINDIRDILGADYPVEKHFSPQYNPWDQRFCICPDGDFFKAIKTGRASVVTDAIDTFTERGIALKSGRENENREGEKRRGNRGGGEER
jgi:monooxygenase